jgi:hypothetical protein
MGVRTKYLNVRVPKVTPEENIWNYDGGDNKKIENNL